MRKLFTILLSCLLSLPLLAQEGVKKVAILEVVDREGSVSYGMKLQLRMSLTAAITQTPGYEAYDRVDMAAIFGEHDFQRTGVVNDEQIKKLGEMSGCDFVLIAEAAQMDANNLIIAAKVVNVTTARVERSADNMVSTTAGGIRKGGQQLAEQLFVAETPVEESEEVTVIAFDKTLQAAKERIAAEKEALAKERAEEKARRDAERAEETARRNAEREALAKERAEEKARLAAEREVEKMRRETEIMRKNAEKEAQARAKAEEKERAAAEKQRLIAEKQAEEARRDAERAAERAWRRAHPYRDQKVRFLVSGGIAMPEADGYDDDVFPSGDAVVGWQKSPHWFLGGGIGLTTFGEYGSEYCNQREGSYCNRYNHEYCYGHSVLENKRTVIPIYFDARLYWFRSKFSPYFNAKIGTTYNLTHKWLGGIYAAPSLGIAIGRFSVAVEGQFLIEVQEIIDSSGAINPQGNGFVNLAVRAEWAF